ncbi:50S ribosomal protein L15 [Treponema sp.]|uniref:50S ribosomal protein L15 n=1 Tax=Treponema sp. TaxID=166 RepID=UPI001D95D80C|nr:50S ribosomal protein L15 [Treponema sp.]MBS7242253.1 50S ribosomal protein L15 [Treponema sp.]MCI6442011.1 50S ribosomal protein L15 [Spirochaetia bacterium]
MANENEFELHAPHGANKKPKRVGRGSSSGLGSTAGKGNKGQQSRSGSAVPYVGFEGGQMPLYRRIARRGFSNAPFKKVFACVNLCDLEAKFADGETVNRESLKNKGLLGKVVDGVKVLGNGDITKKLNVEVEKISASAKDKIEKAGGSVKIIEKAVKESK